MEGEGREGVIEREREGETEIAWREHSGRFRLGSRT